MPKEEDFLYTLAGGMTTGELEQQEQNWHKDLVNIDIPDLIKPMHGATPKNICQLQWDNQRAIQIVDEIVTLFGFPKPDYVDSKAGGRAMWFKKNNLLELSVYDKDYAKYYRGIYPPTLSCVKGIVQLRMTPAKAQQIYDYDNYSAYIPVVGELTSFAPDFVALIVRFCVQKLNCNGEANVFLNMDRMHAAPERTRYEYHTAMEKLYKKGESVSFEKDMPVAHSAFRFIRGDYL